ncbi:MFS transporter [Streptomyces sp. NPDC006743]|uniref:MFS transporter n=1 Tax=Streptomyces sp. NPDC006743 TaxID=3154480 RepID=UPI00345256CE
MADLPPAPVRRAVRPARRTGSPRTVLLVMCTGYFLVLLDVTVVNVALPRIGAALGTGVAGLQWVVDGYALALACLMLTSGTAGDRYGHRRVVLAGFAVFGAGSLACGLAPGVPVLVVARIVQGVGAALLLPGTLAVVGRAFPEDAARARAIGLWAGVGSLALPAGPLLGGVLVDGLGWRAVFLVNVPIVLVALVRSARVLDESRESAAPPLDLPGMLLGALLLCATTYAFIQGGRSGPGAPRVAAAAVIALFALAALGIAETRRGESAMLPTALLRRPAFAAANTAAGIMNLGTLGTLFVLTLFLQTVQGRSALQAGLVLLPLFAPLAVIAPFGGRITSRTGARLPAAAGLLCAAVGLALLARAAPHSSFPVLLPALLLWGVGLGVLTLAVVAAAVASVPGERSGLASAVNNTARQTGGAIGIAVAGAVAGQPDDADRFLSGLHAVALGSACLYAASVVLVLALLPGVAHGRAAP